MKRILMIAAALASLAFAAAPSPTQAATSVGFSVRIGDPYRGTSIRFQSEPDLVLVPRSNVYYVRDYDRDIYRYGRAWYFVEDGYWYRARSYRGPFYRVDFRFVPREVYMVPTGYRRHWGGSYGNYGGRQTWYRDSEYRGYRTRDRYGNYQDNRDRYQGRVNQDPYNRDRTYQNQDPRYREQDPRTQNQDPRTQNQDPRYQGQDPRYQGQDPRTRTQDPRYRDNGAGSGSRDQTQDRNRSNVRNSFPDQNNNGVDDRTENQNPNQNQNQDQGQGRSHGNNGRHKGHGNGQDNGKDNGKDNGNGHGNGGN